MSLKLGIIGLSPGNGHPYSWSAIFNGYDVDAMSACPFPVIPAYLAEQDWPQARVTGAEVTHIWTQDMAISKDVAAAARIPHIVDHFEDMIGSVEAVLLARDDAQNHAKFAYPFIEAGLPIYIDKPVALSKKTYDDFLKAQHFDGQIFTCSALRFAREFTLSDEDFAELGEIERIRAIVPKYWDTYAVHLIDPIIANILSGFRPADSRARSLEGNGRQVHVWDQAGRELDLTTLGDRPGPLEIEVFGTGNWRRLTFKDTFPAFRGALAAFVEGIETKTIMSDPALNRRIVDLIERGRAS